MTSWGDTVIESFDELATGLQRLSNHFHKYQTIVEKHGPALRQRLEECGMTGKVHLWRKSHNYQRQMAAVAEVSRSPEEKKRFIGTYFALQMLHVHFLSIETLRRETKRNPHRLIVYRQILTRLRFQLRTLISTYIGALIQCTIGYERMNGIAICNVGMIMDQDDLDVGVFVSPGVDKVYWNTVIAQMATEFLKYSAKMHFYLAELVSKKTFLTTVADFQNYLKHYTGDYVLVSELLVTEYLTGDMKPVRRLEEVIIEKFYYDKQYRRLHEVYLRSLMGEVQRQIQRKIDPTWASPKTDALRLIHNSMNLLKTIFGIHEHGSRDTLDILVTRDPTSQQLYSDLQDALSFCEMFLYVYQITISVNDRFDPRDPVSLDNLDTVAEIMGFPPLGPLRPAIRLLTHYYEQLNTLSALGAQVMEKVDDHLKRITVFNDLFAGRKPSEFDVNWTDSLIRNLFFAFKQFRGARYWDDILHQMSEDDGRCLNQLVRSIEELPHHHRLHLFRKLIEIVAFDMDSMILLAELFQRYIHFPTSLDYSEELTGWLMEILTTDTAKLTEFLHLIHSHPSNLTHFLNTLTPPRLVALEKAISELPFEDEPQDEQLKTQFKLLSRLLAISSNNYRRFFSRVIQQRPELVTHIDDMPYLNRVGDLLWAELSDGVDPADLKARLTTYYQFGFCRCGLEAFSRPGNLRAFYKKYHAFFRRYFRWLYRAAQWSVEMQRKFEFEFRSQDEDDQPLAIFCTGGYAREEAFENDIDLIIVCGDAEPAFLQYGSMIVNEINRELSRQGVSPHHRFAELFNSFVIPLDRMEDRLREPRPTDFIEWAQLMGARQLVGSQSYDRALTGMLERHVFERPGRFIQDLLSEINDRRDAFRRTKTRSVNVKENPGGLRDIQTILLACQAAVGYREPDIWKTLTTLKEKLPLLTAEFSILERAYLFFRTFKDIYYLSLSAEDDMIRDRLIHVSQRMGIEPDDLADANGTSPRLVNSYRGHRYRARQAIDIIAGLLLKQIDSGDILSG
ncbi:hypothetical protein JXA80_08830 [bacterium]|nr:hypothetical protein [candidate division CSSED10-310 bacterium]